MKTTTTFDAQVRNEISPIIKLINGLEAEGYNAVGLLRGWSYDFFYEEEIISTLADMGYDVALTDEYLHIRWDRNVAISL